MMMSITFVEYQVIFNSDQIGNITPERDLTHGCNLLHYLYI